MTDIREFTICMCGREKMRMTRKDNPHNESFYCDNKNCVMYSNGSVENWKIDKVYQMRVLRRRGRTIRAIADKLKTPKSTIWKSLSTSGEKS